MRKQLIVPSIQPDIPASGTAARDPTYVRGYNVNSRIVNLHGVEALASLLGTEVAVSEWFVIEQERVQRFAEATGDLQWIHLDADRAARESPFHAPVAHGYLTLSLLPMWMQQCVHIGGLRMGVNYGLNRVRFPAPVPVGSRLRCRFHLHAIEPIDDGVQAQWNAQVERDGESKPVCIAEWLLRYYPGS